MYIAFATRLDVPREYIVVVRLDFNELKKRNYLEPIPSVERFDNEFISIVLTSSNVFELIFYAKSKCIYS